jgi:arabinose-5-phosphate isomerase
MSTQPVHSLPLSRFEQLRFGREVLRSEGLALTTLAEKLPLDEFCSAVELIYRCPGRVVVSGMGKAGLIARKISATLCSTGTPSQFLHPAEAVHGDLGCIRGGDVALVLSFSGQTEEVVRLLPSLQQFRVPWIAITSQPQSAIAQFAAVVLDLGPLKEVCPFGIAPSTSTTTMLALGDALALVVSRLRGFATEDFVRYHPAGSLGRKLTKVEEVMRPLDDCRIAHQRENVRQVIISQSRPGRRTGAIMLIDDEGQLTGIFTDSDLARLVGQLRDNELDQPIERVMTKTPKAIPVGEPLERALQILEQYKISELPVVEPCGRPIGLIDVTDLIGVPGCQQRAAVPEVTTPTESSTVPFPPAVPKMPWR